MESSAAAPIQGKFMSPPAFQLKAMPGGEAEKETELSESPTQMKAGAGAAAAGDGGDAGGNGLPGDLKTNMESMSGQDLSDVQVHKNSAKPGEIGAHAYAKGSDIYLGPGQEKHLPHEAWHTVQQKTGRVTPTTDVGGVAVNDDPGLESEADRMGDKAAQMKVDPSAAPQTSGSANTSQVAQKQDPVTTGLLQEYQGWDEAELKRDISGNLYDSINTLQSIRINSWLGNAGIQETRPGAVLLGIALDILSAGIGKAIGGVITGAIQSAISRQITQEFVDGLAGKSLDMVLGAATNGIKGLTNPAAQDSSNAASRGVAITAQNGLAQYYTEGANVLLLDAKTSNVSQFNAESSNYDRNELIVMHKGLKTTYETLRDDASAFMQELTIGYMKLRDELYLDDQASGQPGATREERLANLYANDSTIDETTARAGNMIVLGPTGGIGEWSSPNPQINRVNVSGLNQQTREHLAGATLADLPFSMGFRFWGSNPNRGLLGSVFCKVWFTRRPNGTIAVDMDESWDRESSGYDQGREWLARYNTGNSGEMSDEDIRTNVAGGAMKLWNAIKNTPVPANVANYDMF
ncbi:MAG: DUF4157 domain-containing protein [Bacteroidota bacterium]